MPFEMNTVYLDDYTRSLYRKIHKARTETVVHQETCPCCGAKNVNLYRKSVNDKEWRCRKCWEKGNCNG